MKAFLGPLLAPGYLLQILLYPIHLHFPLCTQQNWGSPLPMNVPTLGNRPFVLQAPKSFVMLRLYHNYILR